MTRRQFPGCVSFAEAAGIWERGGFTRYLPSLRENWLPWIEGRSTFAEAIERLAAALPYASASRRIDGGFVWRGSPVEPQDKTPA